MRLWPLIMFLSWSCLAQSTNIWVWGDCSTGCGAPAGLTNARAVVIGWAHYLALQPDGTVVAWGDNSLGQCAVPAGLTNAVGVAAGLGHSLALRTDGTVIGWGDDSDGQADPRAFSARILSISTSRDHNLAVLADGTVQAWGNNDFGQCSVPPGLENSVEVAAGWFHSLSRSADGSVQAWGLNSAGQCDVPSTLTNAVAIAAGFDHGLAVRADGTIAAWGDNSFGQCSVPGGITNAVGVAAGRAHSAALLADGSVRAWGDNSLGQCDVPFNLPRVISLAANVDRAVAAVNLVAPTILLASPSQTRAIGSSINLFVSAIGGLPLAYQWFQNGNPVPGATNSVLSLPNAQSSASGNYTVEVTNSGGSVYSAAIYLNLLPGLRVDMVPAITLTGSLNKQYRIDFLPTLGYPISWQTLGTVTLTNSPQFYFDTSAIGDPYRFYRMVELP